MSATTLAAVITIAVLAAIVVVGVANAIRDVGIARATGRDPVRDRKADERADAAHRGEHLAVPPLSAVTDGHPWNRPLADRLGDPPPHATGGSKD